MNRDPLLLGNSLAAIAYRTAKALGDAPPGFEAFDAGHAERLLQGPLSDAMAHVGQLALLRRLSGSPIAPEDFSAAAIHPSRLGPDQAPPTSPDHDWPEAPDDWIPAR
jgi:hypothetical protein